MPTGHEFSVNEKVLIFKVIRFCEQEKTGPVIPLNNVIERISTLLGISERSVNRMKKELSELLEQEKQELEKQEKQKREEEDKENANKYQLRNRIKSDSTLKHRQTSPILPQPKISHERKRHTGSLTASITQLSIPKPYSPKKKDNSGFPKLFLTEYATDVIRYQFHLLLQDKIYPTTARLLSRLHESFDDFPIHSISKLWLEMKKVGFTYQRTSQVKIPLDSTSFIASRARYFETMKKLRDSHAQIYFHDESWVNLGDVRRNIWVYEGQGRLRQSDGKGKRFAISALISPQGYHHDSVDIFACSEEHNMDSDRFVNWITDTSMKLRILHGNEAKIAIVLDNAPWHNVLTPESIAPKRSWRKGQIQEWLNDHHVSFDSRSVKAELLELALANAPPKEYITDQAAGQFNVQIVRLPHRHCCLNPIELSWNNLKQYVRDNNVTFKQNDVYNLILHFMGALDTELATSYFKHVEKVEQTFKDADVFLEEDIEPNLVEEETMTEEEEDDDDDE